MQVSHSPPKPQARNSTGARAIFVTHLGRRVAELQQTITALGEDPGKSRTRDDLRRRLHALTSAARVLKFHGMAEQLSLAEQLLEKATSSDEINDQSLTALRKIIDELPSLAWGEPTHDAPQTAGASGSSAQRGAAPMASWPTTALVIGPAALANALQSDELETNTDKALECERTEDVQSALTLARALGPDVALLDADMPGIYELAGQLVDDPLTEPVALVIVGTFASPERVSRWLALGVAKVLPKPASPAQIQHACLEAVAASKPLHRPAPLGEPTLDALATRLAEELRRGLCDAASAQAHSVRVPLGDGADVLAAVWSAVARVREIVSVRSQGNIRFSNLGPEGAVPLALWSPDTARNSAHRISFPDTTDPAIRLQGRTVLVADDDPAITWFLSGVLRAAGALVLAAHDGEAALAIACRASPDLVISDVLMPHLDGFALCRALKRDIALRDVPVILLSWKEDLLQRVRELGALADGYLLKEASAAVILERSREVLRPRLRVEAQLTSTGEIRGRLDGLTVWTLLSLVSKHRPNARVSVRDASYLYEVELREGSPCKATRTAAEGTFERGPAVLARMLGVGAGRFTIVSADTSVRRDLEGSLETQLYPAIARARGAQRLLSGSSLLEVDRIEIDLASIEPYLAATPEPSRSVVRRLAAGESPRALVLSATVAPHLLEDILTDAVVHGAIAGVRGRNGEDLLLDAVESENALLERGITTSIIPPSRMRSRVSIVAPLPPTGMPSASATMVSKDTSATLVSKDTAENAIHQGEEASEDTPLPLSECVSTPPSDLMLQKQARDSVSAEGDEGSPFSSRTPHEEPTPELSSERLLLSVLPKSPPATPTPSAPYQQEPSHSAHASSPWVWVSFVLACITAGGWWFGKQLIAPRETGSAFLTKTTTPLNPNATASSSVAPWVSSSSNASASSRAAFPKASSAPSDLIPEPEDLALPSGTTIPDGYGLLEVVTLRRDAIFVDQLDMGRGPRLMIPLAAGTHDLRARRRGEEQPFLITVHAGHLTKVDLRGQWHPQPP